MPTFQTAPKSATLSSGSSLNPSNRLLTRAVLYHQKKSRELLILSGENRLTGWGYAYETPLFVLRRRREDRAAIHFRAQAAHVSYADRDHYRRRVGGDRGRFDQRLQHLRRDGRFEDAGRQPFYDRPLRKPGTCDRRAVGTHDAPQQAALRRGLRMAARPLQNLFRSRRAAKRQRQPQTKRPRNLLHPRPGGDGQYGCHRG